MVKTVIQDHLDPPELQDSQDQLVVLVQLETYMGYLKLDLWRRDLVMVVIVVMLDMVAITKISITKVKQRTKTRKKTFKTPRKRPSLRTSLFSIS